MLDHRYEIRPAHTDRWPGWVLYVIAGTYNTGRG